MLTSTSHSGRPELFPPLAGSLSLTEAANLKREEHSAQRQLASQLTQSRSASIKALSAHINHTEIRHYTGVIREMNRAIFEITTGSGLSAQILHWLVDKERQRTARKPRGYPSASVLEALLGLRQSLTNLEGLGVPELEAAQAATQQLADLIQGDDTFQPSRQALRTVRAALRQVKARIAYEVQLLPWITPSEQAHEQLDEISGSALALAQSIISGAPYSIEAHLPQEHTVVAGLLN